MHRIIASGSRFRSALRRRGLRSLTRRAWVKIARRLGRDLADPYRDWIEAHAPGVSDLAEQRRWASTTPGPPRIALVIRRGDGPRRGLSRTLRSLRRQSYPHWSPVIVPEGAGPPTLGLDAHDYVGIVRAGDTLSPEALHDFARAIVERDPRPDALYCDEDHLAADGRTRRRPIFKPSWSPEMLLGSHYSGRLTLVRREVVEEAGGFDPSLGETAEWDLMLRVSARTDRVVRIPRCLYHNGPGVALPEPGRRRTRSRAVPEAHLRRLGHADPRAIERPDGTFRPTWKLPDHPLVSVIIPTKDGSGRARQLVEGLLARTDYPNMEVILVDHGSTDPETRFVSGPRSGSGEKAVTVLPSDRPFSHEASCNLGAAGARGELLLFLADDVEVIEPDWLEELVRWGRLPGIGVVGTKLVGPDGGIRHAGIALDTLDQSRIGRRIFSGMPEGPDADPADAPFGSPDVYRNLSAVGDGCQLIKRSLFEAIGGYDRRVLGGGGEVALCLAASGLGHRNLYAPHAALVRHDDPARRPPIPFDDVLLIAQILRRIDFRDDPFWHPALDPERDSPTLRPDWAASPAEMLRRQVDDLARLLPVDPSPNPTTRAGRNGECDRLMNGAPPDGSNVRDAESAARFVIDVLRDEGVAGRFPRALGEGADGAFCRWLCSEGISRYGLADGAPVLIREAFASHPGGPVGCLIDYLSIRDPRYRIARLPGLLPALSDWLERQGGNYGLFDGQIRWFLHECREDPLRELVRIYLINPDWQRHFPGIEREAGWARFARWIGDRYGFDATADPGRPHEPATAPDGPPAYIPPATSGPPGAPSDAVTGPEGRGKSDRFGLNVLGHFSIPCGIGVSAASIVESLGMLGIGTSCRDVLSDAPLSHRDRSRFLGLETYGTTLYHTQPAPYFSDCHARAGLLPRRDIYKVAMWYWEFGRIPDEWRAIAATVDELWAPTRFIGDALREAVDVPVFELTPGLRVGAGVPFDRARAGIPADHALFLFVFDMGSVMERKNPLGLIAAFREAFGPDDGATLLIKTANVGSFPAEAARLREAAREAGVVVLDRSLGRPELVGLIEACDCYVSLHRSEGLGLTMAEAMLLGKPVIATGYSGNLEFMDRSNSLLVGHDLVPIGREIPPYPADLLWAEPSIAEAAEAMRQVFERPDEARAIGEAGRRSVEERLSMDAAGRRFADRLRSISEGRAAR